VEGGGTFGGSGAEPAAQMRGEEGVPVEPVLVRGDATLLEEQPVGEALLEVALRVLGASDGVDERGAHLVVETAVEHEAPDVVVERGKDLGGEVVRQGRAPSELDRRLSRPGALACGQDRHPDACRPPVGDPVDPVDSVGVQVEARSAYRLSRLLRAEREVGVTEVGQAVLKPKALQSQGRDDAGRDRDTHVGGRPPEHVVDDPRRAVGSREVLEVVEDQGHRSRAVVALLEERVDHGDRLRPQSRGAQWLEGGTEPVVPGAPLARSISVPLVEACHGGGGQQVGDQPHGLTVRGVHGQPQRRAVPAGTPAGGREDRRLAVAGHAREHDHRPLVQQREQARTSDEPRSRHGEGHARLTRPDHVNLIGGCW
jgi:hypothetical protein